MTGSTRGDACIGRLAMMARWLFACGTLCAAAAPASAQSPPYVAGGIRWIGTAKECTAPAGWRAERVFSSAPVQIGNLCLYLWLAPAKPPSPAQISKLFSDSGAAELTEDVPVVFPSAPFSPPEVALFEGLHDALLGQVGTAALLPDPPEKPLARIVVIDSAPDAPAGHIVPGASRHGDTLAHLIEDIVCVQIGDRRRCAAEVTTALALPETAPGAVGGSGGHVGTLTDLARAIERAVLAWKADLASQPPAPPRLVLNLSLGWEHTAGIADCTTDVLAALKPPARAVRAILQYASTQGALIVAAAGNDSGGPTPRTGLVCPGRYQSVPKDTDSTQSLVIAVSGVDYQDHPLALTRPSGDAGIAALGLGGVAWQTGDPVPPPLTGTSVSTAVVSAIAGLVWSVRQDLTPAAVASAIYRGGVDLGSGSACPRGTTLCRSRRASVCGALRGAGITLPCSPPVALPSSCPSLPTQVAALAAAYSGLPPRATSLIPLTDLPRDLAPTVQLAPEVFPTPISATCPTCAAVNASFVGAPVLVIPALGQDVNDAVLVVQLPGGGAQALQVGSLTAAGAPYAVALPLGWTLQSAYLTGLGNDGFSVTEQIFVQN